MREIEYTVKFAKIHITGVIANKDEEMKYLPRPLFCCDLISNRKRKNEDQLLVADVNRLVVFDDEKFIDEYEEGDEVEIIGEVQSRNWTDSRHKYDELLKTAVENYMILEDDKLPSVTKPERGRRELIDWGKLLKHKLIDFVPDDSMYLEDMSKQKNEEKKFMYRVDENGEVFKETQHVAYEILVSECRKIDPPKNELIGHINKYTGIVKVTRDPYYNIGNNNIPFCSFNIQAESSLFPDRHFYLNVICWDKLADEVANVVVGTELKITGRLQTRDFIKKVVLKKKTSSNKTKKTTIEVPKKAVELSASSVMIAKKKPQPEEENN